MRMELYRWQQQALKAWQREGCRGIAHVATGAGKTVLALQAMDVWLKRHADAVVKIVVPTIPLAHQWESALLSWADADEKRPAFFGGGSRSADGRVMIYIINSAREALPIHARRALSTGRHVLLICDECHHCQSPQNRKIFDFLTPEVIAGGCYASLGLSATPFGTENDAVLVNALGPEICRYGFDEAVQEGVLSSFVIADVGVSFFSEERDAYVGLTHRIIRLLEVLKRVHPELMAMDRNAFLRALHRMAKSAGMDSDDPSALFLKLTFERKRLSDMARCRVACGVELLTRLREDDRVLVFCQRIEQAEAMAAAIRRRLGDICTVYHSGMTAEARQRCMQAFREHRVRVLVSCRCLDEGIDVPEANIGIVLSSSAVSRQRIQRMGRVVRRAPGKDAACLYYLYVREAADDAAYLPQLQRCERFHLDYSAAENAFSNALYEVAANDLLDRAEASGWNEASLRELRRCLVEGLVRADYLLPQAALQARLKQRMDAHARNYIRAMRAMSRAFHEAEEKPEGMPLSIPDS